MGVTGVWAGGVGVGAGKGKGWGWGRWAGRCGGGGGGVGKSSPKLLSLSHPVLVVVCQAGPCQSCLNSGGRQAGSSCNPNLS